MASKTHIIQDINSVLFSII